MEADRGGMGENTSELRLHLDGGSTGGPRPRRSRWGAGPSPPHHNPALRGAEAGRPPPAGAYLTGQVDVGLAVEPFAVLGVEGGGAEGQSGGSRRQPGPPGRGAGLRGEDAGRHRGAPQRGAAPLRRRHLACPGPPPAAGHAPLPGRQPMGGGGEGGD